MTKKCRVAVFTYLPNNGSPEPGTAFAVFAATEHVAVLVGVNLSALGITHKNPDASWVFEDTMGLVRNRVMDVIKASNPKTGYALLDGVVSKNLSSIVSRPIRRVAGTDAWTAAWTKFKSEIRPLPARVPQIQRGREITVTPGWRED